MITFTFTFPFVWLASFEFSKAGYWLIDKEGYRHNTWCAAFTSKFKNNESLYFIFVWFRISLWKIS